MASSTGKKKTFSDDKDLSLLLRHLNAQRSNSRFCDVVLKVSGHNIHAHSNVLAAASPYFGSFLGNGQDYPRAYSQKLPQIIEIHIDGSEGTNIYVEAVKKVVDYMYTGRIELSTSILTQVVDIAKIMQMNSILHFCDSFQKEDEKESKSGVFSNTINQSQAMKTTQESTQHSLKGKDNSNQMPECNQEEIRAQKDIEHKVEYKSDSLSETKNAVNKSTLQSNASKLDKEKKLMTRKPEKQLYLSEESSDQDSNLENEDIAISSDAENEAESALDENDENTRTNTYQTRGRRKRKMTMKMRALKKSQKSKPREILNKDKLDLEKFRDNLNGSRSKDKNYQCSECCYSTDTKYHFQRHCQAHKSDVEKHSCSECNFSTSKLRTLKKHKVKHLHEKFQCSICFFQGENKDEFSKHMQKHSGPKPYFCHSCDATFINKAKLHQHLPKHSVDHPYVCQYCSRGFKWKHALKNHMITHSNSKDHLCDVCGFATAHKSQLKAHRLIHTGETFKCHLCPFQATKKQNLKYHMLTHTHEKPHQCEVCGQSFSLNKNMKRHMLLHSNERPFKCDQCSFSAVRNDKLKEHQLKHHGIGESPKKRHRLSDYYNSVIPAQENDLPTMATTIENIQYNIQNPSSQSVTTDAEEIQIEDIPTTHVIIEGDHGFPVTLARVTEGGTEMTYQFVAEVQ